MAFEEYLRKRDFANTPEPRPGRGESRSGELSYLIQKHEATRLHYDFRLELDGVLLSWAVTKGPSLNPADRRLAVRTEDHPLSYGAFEGTIPKGQYGGGTVMMWDVGTWEPAEDPRAGLRKGHLRFVLHGKRLKGGWALVRMHGDEKRENWLLIKARDEEARVNGAVGFLDHLGFSVTSGRSMDAIAAGETRTEAKRQEGSAASHKAMDNLLRKYPGVQLATLVEAPPDGDDWLHEIKFDGYRLLGFSVGDDIRLRTRNGLDWTGKFPTVAEALRKLKTKDAVLDMEAVVLDAQGKSGFQALQEALGEGGHRERIVAYAFDLLRLDGDDLTGLQLTERKRKLRTLLTKSRPGNALRFSDHVQGGGRQMLAKSCQRGLEGIVSKLAGSPYRSGRERTWLKVKCILRQEFIIVGYSDARSGGRALGALYLAYRKDGALQYAGKVGTGFTMKSARALTDRLIQVAADKPVLSRAEMRDTPAMEWRSVHWAKPLLLCEIAFTEWTGDGRIRHPSFQGMREDKESEKVTRETPAKATAMARITGAARRADALVLNGINITHPDRVISEAGHITKGQLAGYHAAVAPFMLADIGGRPLSLLRCPTGINDQCFFQRNPGTGLGPDVRTFTFRRKSKSYKYLYIDDEKGLLELIQMGAIELHPWGARVGSIDFPDRLIFDLDPAPDVPFDAVKLAARDLRKRLRKNGLDSMLKCTGGKGLHVTVPLAGQDQWPRVKSFAAQIAAEMVADVPSAYVATMTKAQRSGKIFIDYFRNDYTATAIADYGVRARPGAPVALPIDWKELKDLKSANQFTMKDVLMRLKAKKPSISLKGQRLPQ